MFRLTTLIVLFALLVPGLAAADDPKPPAQHQLTFMTRNVYHGVDAEIFSVPSAGTFQELLNRVAAVYLGYQARDFPARAQALAAEIDATRPALIGVQEAVLVRTGPFLSPASAETVAWDYVQLLLDALSARGLHYAVVTEIRGFDIELPSALGFDVRHTDREVVLARTDLPPGHLELSNVQTGHFVTNCGIWSPLSGQITILRGWASVDVWTRGRAFRFISTHLDGDCLAATTAIQVAQVGELANGPAATDLPVVLAADINASAGDSTPTAYSALVQAGFVDAWGETAGGFTCCQADDLSNPISLLTTRIDVLMTRPRFDLHTIAVTGDNPADRTPSGLWPSDHGGVVATLTVP